MELRHLRYFVAVAESGSFSRAAQRLFIAQPPLSTQIRQLEVELDTPLFVRTPRGVTLTTSGEALLLRARALIAGVEELPSLVRPGKTARRLPLRIGIIPSVLYTVLPEIVARLGAEENIDIEPVEVSSAGQLAALEEGRLDFGFVRLTEVPASVEVLCARDDPWSLALHQDHRLNVGKRAVSLAQFATDRVICLGRGHSSLCFDQAIALCLNAGFSPRFVLEASSFHVSLGYVAACLGVALVPASTVVMSPPLVRYRKLNDATIRGRLLLVMRKGAVQHGVDLLRATVEREFRSLDKRVREAMG
jgi:DNA-binding transcriptional LysR family regulator